MSNEKMTDVIAELESIQRLGGLGHTTHARIDNCIDRLRGEAAQDEQQAVAWSVPNQLRKWGKHESERVMKLTKEAQPEHGFTVPLYTHPQPVAVAGDAVRALADYWRQVAKDIGDKDSLDDGMAIAHRSCADELDAVLSGPTGYKGMIRADENGVMSALAERILGNAHPEENARIEVAYSIARYLGMDCPAAMSAAPAAPEMPPKGTPFVGCQCPSCGEEFAASAAPAPVAGDAVAAIAARISDRVGGSGDFPGEDEDGIALWDLIANARGDTDIGDAREWLEDAIGTALHVALAQDRAAQGAAAGVPTEPRRYTRDESPDA